MKSILEFLMKHPAMVMIISLSLYFSSLLLLPGLLFPKMYTFKRAFSIDHCISQGSPKKTQN